MSRGGVAFDRFYQVWLENEGNQDPDTDEKLKMFASQGIQLTQFYGLAHSSEPNFCTAVSGDTFGMDNDGFHQIPDNISTIADILDVKRISWAEYQENIPYPGFQGNNYSKDLGNKDEGDYVRKHDPLILFNSIAEDESRARQIKSFDEFEKDMEKDEFPQWTLFTPSSGNIDIPNGAELKYRRIKKLVEKGDIFKNTLVLVTMDENKDYSKPNRIFSFLVGSAIPEHLKGTTDNTFYTHYSSIATVSANWELPSLGRWDCGANIFQIVANKTGYKNAAVDAADLELGHTYPGPLSNGTYSKYQHEWPVPVTKNKCSAGHGVADIVKASFGNQKPTYNYTYPYPWDSSSNYNIDAAKKSKKGVAASVAISGSVTLIAVLVGFFPCLGMSDN